MRRLVHAVPLLPVTPVHRPEVVEPLRIGRSRWHEEASTQAKKPGSVHRDYGTARRQEHAGSSAPSALGDERYEAHISRTVPKACRREFATAAGAPT